MPQSFPKTFRLRKRREFLAVQATGRRLHGQHFVVLVSRSTSSDGRLGITVSKKVGGAVTRNRVKRWVREFVRRTRWLPAQRDVVVIARSSAGQLTHYDDVARDLLSLRARLT